MPAIILLIEDDPNLTALYKSKFEDNGFTVLTAANGQDGISQMKMHKPRLVFLDIIMPKLSGLDTLKRIKQDPEIAKIPVIMLTILSAEQEGENSLLLGAVAYLVKSEVTPQDVINKAKEVLGTSEKPFDPRFAN